MALDTNLISHWKLDESSGNAADSVGSNTLTNTGTATYAAAKINNGVTLNGSSQYLQASSAILSGTAVSVSVWLKSGSATQSQDKTVFSCQKDSSAGIFVSRSTAGTANAYSLTYGNGSSYQGYGSDTFAISTTDWEHYVFIVNGNAVKIYRNGTNILNTTRTGTLSFTSAGNFTVGINPPITAGRYWNGSLDELGTWTRELSADEVSQIFNSGRANAYPFTATPSLYGAVSYWKLNETSGNAADSINSNTLTNNNTVAFSAGKINNGADFGVSNSSKSFSIADNVSLSITGALSISFWFKSSSSGYHHIIEKDDESSFNRCGYDILYDIGKISFGIGNNSGYPAVTTDGAYNNGNWHFVTCVYVPSTSMTIYIDGSSVKVLSTGVPSAIYDNSNPFNIGLRNNGFGPDRYYSGMLDEVSIWSRALTSGEITALYNAGNGNQYPFGTAYALVATLQTYALTGIAALFPFARNMTAALGTFTLTGIDALFSMGKGIMAETGAYILTGIDTTVKSTRTMVTSVGAFTLTGIDIIFQKGFGIFAEAGSFILTGFNAVLRGSNIWTNISKNTSTWTNAVKNSSTWSNIAKVVSSWTNLPKA